MIMKLWVRQEFEAAHNLKGTFPPGHQCCRVHGHRYEVKITLAVEDDGQDVMVDYHEMHAGLKEELDKFDHRYLNEVMDAATTCENLARLLWRRLERRWTELDEVEVQEQSNTGCVLTR